jgi:hypothetical protein
MDHPCCTPDLAPSDLHLFQQLKKKLDGQGFETDVNVKQVVISCLQIILPEGTLMPLLDKRLNDNIDYIDVWCVQCAMFVSCIHGSQSNVLCSSVFATLSFGTPLNISKKQNTEANISFRYSELKTAVLNRMCGAQPFLRN